MNTPPLASKTNTRKPSLPVIIFHWVIVIAVLVSFFSGQRIASDHLYDHYQHTTLIEWWLSMLPQGAVFDWHYSSGYLLVAFISAYLLMIFCNGHYRFLLIKAGEHRAKKWNKIVIWLGVMLLLSQAITGIIINAELAPSLPWIRYLHRLSAWLFVAYLILHLATIANAKGWKHWFYLFFGSLKSTMLASITLAIGWGIASLLTRPISHHLEVLVTNEPPKVDGLVTDLVWQQAKSHTIYTKHGNGDRDIAIDVQASHDGERLYLLLRWPDSEESLNHLPLLKTQAGWQIENTQLAQHDERIFYEDKLAVMLSNQSVFSALRSIHLGQQPLDSAPSAKHQRGYHYTQGELLDMWHWKAVRSNGFFQADDNFFGPAKLPQAGALRYKAGYDVDPSDGGGYESNYDFYQGRIESTVTPLRLPRNTEHSWMRWPDGNAYHPKADQQIAIGTRIPSTVTHGPMEGDRGDVGARGQWKDGYWYLELSRALDTQSKVDTPIQPGTLLWFAIFDHSQTRHSYHLWPIKLWWQQQ